MGSVRGLNYVLPRPAPRRRPSPARRPLRSLHINSSHRGKSLRSRAIIFIPYCTEREQQQGAGASEAARVGARRENEVSLQSVVSHYHTHSYQTEHTVPSPVDELRGWGPTVGRRPAGWCTPRMHTTSAVRVQRYPLVLAAIPCCRRSPRVSPPPSPPAHAAPVVHVLRFPMPRLNLLAPAVMRTRAAHAHRPRSPSTTAAARP